MNSLIETMAMNMNIQPYINETQTSFEYRVIYSALGLWCLKSALSEKEDVRGISKSAQSVILHNLIEKYVGLFPETSSLLLSSKSADIAVFIRNIYEQTGYLITQDNNSNILNKSGETVQLTHDEYLYLGLPTADYAVEGLGIHTRRKGVEIILEDFLIRDKLTPEEYVEVNFDECDFDMYDIALEKLEFFDPCYYGNAANTWHRDMNTDITIARKSPMGPYYRVIKKAYDRYIFAEGKNMDNRETLTGKEFRRLYVALKKYYDNPMQILICPIDELYSQLYILGQIPNREYYYLLMNAWPQRSFLDRNKFIVSNKLTTKLTEVLEAIGFVVRNGEFYG